MDLKEYIINRSKEINIDIIGFSNCEPLYRIEDYLKYKRKNKLDTEFEEKNLELRIDPKLSLDSCRSIITIGMSYNTRKDMEKMENKNLQGIISKSSWGRDYHFVLREKMEELVEEIKKEVDFKYKIYVDTGPLVDREIAYNSQIGYYGKNCSIINEEYGSFIFLGYILTDLDLNIENKNIENQCGDCRICIEACPTGALYDEFKVNSRKCISYLTQTREKIPDELKAKMGRQIYGCDICQLVCPKNKEIKISSIDDFKPRLNGYVNLVEIFSLSNREFKNKYGYMAGSWRGRNIFKRNAIIALGNIGDEEGIKILEKELENNKRYEEEIKWAIKKIKESNEV